VIGEADSRRIVELAKRHVISEQTIYTWRNAAQGMGTCRMPNNPHTVRKPAAQPKLESATAKKTLTRKAGSANRWNIPVKGEALRQNVLWVAWRYCGRSKWLDGKAAEPKPFA